MDRDHSSLVWVGLEEGRKVDAQLWALTCALLVMMLTASTNVMAVEVCDSCTYTTICAVLPSVGANTEVRVHAGTYAETINCTCTASNVTLNLLGQVNVSLDNQPWLSISGVNFTFTNGTLNLMGGLAVTAGATVFQDAAVFINGSSTNTINPFPLLAVIDAVWNQNGQLKVDNAVGSGTPGLLGRGMTWNQKGVFSMSYSSGYAQGVVLQAGSRWVQDGPCLLGAQDGVHTIRDSTWISNGPLTVTTASIDAVVVFQNSTWILNSISLAIETVVSFVSESTWIQNSDFYGTAAQRTGVKLENSVWKQYGAVTLLVGAGFPNPAISGSLQARWNQYGALDVLATGGNIGITCGVAIDEFTWFSNGRVNVTATPGSTGIAGNCSRLPFPSASPQFLITNATGAQSMPRVSVNLNTSTVTITPKDSSGQEQPSAAVSLTLENLTSSNTSSNPAIRNGTWNEVANNSLGASQSFLYSCILDFNTSSSAPDNNRTSTLALQYFVFANTTTIDLGSSAASGPVKFDVAPAFTKFTLTLTDWQWQSPDDASERAEARVAIRPVFTGFTEVASTSAHVREFVLSGQTGQTYGGGGGQGGSASTRLRLVEAVTVDGVLEVVSTRNATAAKSGRLWFTLDTATSELVLSFGRFNSSLVYDPDVGVLLRGKEGGGGSDNTGLIIGVAVAVPLAILVVLAVVVGAVGITYWHSRQRHHGAVNFGADDSAGGL